MEEAKRSYILAEFQVLWEEEEAWNQAAKTEKAMPSSSSSDLPRKEAPESLATEFDQIDGLSTVEENAERSDRLLGSGCTPRRKWGWLAGRRRSRPFDARTRRAGFKSGQTRCWRQRPGDARSKIPVAGGWRQKGSAAVFSSKEPNGLPRTRSGFSALPRLPRTLLVEFSHSNGI